VTKNGLGQDAVAEPVAFISRDLHSMFNTYRVVLGFLAGQGESGSVRASSANSDWNSSQLVGLLSRHAAGDPMTLLTIFGLFAVMAMLVCYALEARSRWFILAFAGACVLGSVYGFLQGAWPFGLVEAVWSVVAIRRWALATRSK
jgi:hypothetical protein